MPFFFFFFFSQDSCRFTVLVGVAFAAFAFCQSLSFLSVKQQLGWAAASGLQHPSEADVTSVAWLHGDAAEQTATLRWPGGC